LTEHFFKTIFNVFLCSNSKKTCFDGFSYDSNSGNDE
jgi:hypothetical protein